MNRWRIYYEDGSVFDSFQGLPEDSPGRGVQGILIWRDSPPPGLKHVQRHTGCDWYGFREGEWFKHDQAGMEDQVVEYPGVVMRQGRATGAHNWDMILKRMNTDPDYQEDGVGVGEDREPQYLDDNP